MTATRKRSAMTSASPSSSTFATALRRPTKNCPCKLTLVVCVLALQAGQIWAQESTTTNTNNNGENTGGWIANVASSWSTSTPGSTTDNQPQSSSFSATTTPQHSPSSGPHHGFLDSGSLSESELNSFAHATNPPAGATGTTSDGSVVNDDANNNNDNYVPSPTLASPAPAPHQAVHINTAAPFRMFGDAEKHETPKVTPPPTTSTTTTTPMHPMTSAALSMASIMFFLFACVVGFRFHSHKDFDNQYVASANQLRLFRHDTLVHQTKLFAWNHKLHVVGLTTRLKAVWKPVLTWVQTVTGFGLLVCTCIAVVQPNSTWNSVLGATCLLGGQVLTHLWYGYARYPMDRTNNHNAYDDEEEQAVFSTAPETVLQQFSQGMAVLVHNGQETTSSSSSCLDVICLPFLAVYHLLTLLGMATILCLGGVVEGCGGRGRLRRRRRRLLQQQQQPHKGAAAPASTFTEEEEHYHRRRQQRAWELATVVGALGGSLLYAYIYMLVPHPGAKIFAALAHRIVDQYYEAKVFRKSLCEFVSKSFAGIFADVRQVERWEAPSVCPTMEQWVEDLRHATVVAANKKASEGQHDNTHKTHSSNGSNSSKETLGSGLDSLEEDEEEGSFHLEDDDHVPQNVETGDLLGMGNNTNKGFHAAPSRFHQSMNEFQRPPTTTPRFNGHGSASRLDILREKHHRRDSTTRRNQILANNEMLRMEILRRAHAELLNTHMTLQYEIEQIGNENSRILNSNNMLEASNYMLQNGKSHKAMDSTPEDTTKATAAEKQVTTTTKRTDASHARDDLTQAATESSSMDEQEAAGAHTFNPVAAGQPGSESDTDILRAKNKELVAMNQKLTETKKELRNLQKELLDQNTVLQAEHEQLLFEEGGSSRYIAGTRSESMQSNESHGHGSGSSPAAANSEDTSFHTSGSIV